MKRVIIATLVVVAAASCRKSELHTDQHGTINLSTAINGFDEYQPQKPDGTQSRSANKTKTATTDFSVGQKLGLFIHTDNPIENADNCHSRNIEYATPDGGATWNQRAALDREIDPAATYYATAYTPFVDGAFPPFAMPVKIDTDQSTEQAVERSDLRIAQNTPITGSGTSLQTTLNFTHALAMFELKLLIPLMVEGGEVDQIEAITFENLATQGTIHLGTGAVTTDLHSVASITPRIVSGTGAIGVLTTYQAIVIPQNVDGGVLLAKIRCQMKDGSTETMDYITPSKGWISFQAGVKTSITLLPTAQAAFVGELPELMDGQAHVDLALPIFVETGLRWTVDAPGGNWLTLADAAGGTYGQKLSGTSATGAWTNIYVKVSANTAQTMPRTGDLTLRAWRTDGSEVTAAVLRVVQNYYAFSPVGGVWNTPFAAASDPIQPFSSNQQWTAESDAAWLLLATSPTVGSGNPSQKFVKAGALGANELYIQVTENTSATARRGVVTISSPVAGTPDQKIYVNQMGNQPYVEINGLRWATGNLVATRSSAGGVSAPGCMIGDPTDGGLYFQFGSLIGWKGGAAAHGGTGANIPENSMNGRWWNGATAWSWANDAMVWPSNMSGTPTEWPKPTTTTNQWYFGLQTGWSGAGQNIRDFPGLATGALSNVGVGDPCTYYLGGTWRMPTTYEINVLCKNQVGNAIPWLSVGGSWSSVPVSGGNFSGTTLFMPAVGLKNGSTGTLGNLNWNAYYWCSSIHNASYSKSFAFYSSGVDPLGFQPRSNGYPARCVQDVPTRPNPPTADDYVEIDMGSGKKLKWTKGNLVAAGTHNAKVGAPADGGLYFQFGSLIGYKGGALANGGTGVGSNPYTGSGTQWWGGAGAYSWANDAMVWPSELVGTKSSWSNTTGSGITTLNDYYFNYSSGWETPEQDIRTFAVPISGDSGSGNLASGRYAKKGVGDPCTYYLGDPWRLPTTVEQASITGKTGSSWIPWTTAGVTGRWATSGQTFGGVSGPGAWFGLGLNAGSGTPAPATNLFFPASGDRANSNGSFYDVAADGYYWSSSVYTATHGYRLGVRESAGVIPQGNNSRSFGFPVRCVASVP